MPRSEPALPSSAADALENQDLPGVPTANWGAYGESTLEAELRRSRVPLGCASILVMVVVLSSAMEGGGEQPPTPAAHPSAAPTPTPAPSPIGPLSCPEGASGSPGSCVFPSCTGRQFDCHGAESCGVLVLETGKIVDFVLKCLDFVLNMFGFCTKNVRFCIENVGFCRERPDVLQARLSLRPRTLATSE